MHGARAQHAVVAHVRPEVGLALDTAEQVGPGRVALDDDGRLLAAPVVDKEVHAVGGEPVRRGRREGGVLRRGPRLRLGQQQRRVLDREAAEFGEEPVHVGQVFEVAHDRFEGAGHHGVGDQAVELAQPLDDLVLEFAQPAPGLGHEVGDRRLAPLYLGAFFRGERGVFFGRHRPRRCLAGLALQGHDAHAGGREGEGEAGGRRLRLRLRHQRLGLPLALFHQHSPLAVVLLACEGALEVGADEREQRLQAVPELAAAAGRQAQGAWAIGLAEVEDVAPVARRRRLAAGAPLRHLALYELEHGRRLAGAGEARDEHVVARLVDAQAELEGPLRPRLPDQLRKRRQLLRALELERRRVLLAAELFGSQGQAVDIRQCGSRPIRGFRISSGRRPAGRSTVRPP